MLDTFINDLHWCDGICYKQCYCKFLKALNFVKSPKIISIQPSNACGPFRDISCGNTTDCVVFDYVTYLIDNGDDGLKDVSLILSPNPENCCPTLTPPKSQFSYMFHRNDKNKKLFAYLT